jgi:hypothetical protein
MPPKARVFGLVHHSHSASPELFEDTVVRESLSEWGCGVRHQVPILGWPKESSQRRGRAPEDQKTTLQVKNLQVKFSGGF